MALGVLLFAAAALLIAVLAATLVLAGGTKVFHLSDFHLDPMFATDCGVGHCNNASAPLTGRPHCDSSNEQVLGAVAAVARTIVALDVETAIVIYTGDALRHGATDACFAARFGSVYKAAEATFANVTDALANQLPKFVERFELEKPLGGLSSKKKKQRALHVFHAANPGLPLSFGGLAMGNDDHGVGPQSPPGDTYGDYYFNISDPTHPHQAFPAFGRDLEKSHFLDNASAATWDKCAFSSRIVSGSGNTQLRVVSLNTLVWATSIRPPAPYEKFPDPCGQWKFLEAELSAARASNQRVYLLSHIPPVVALWQQFHRNKFVAVLKSYNDVVANAFFGHLHRFQFIALSKASDVAPVFIGGPTTRISETVPDFTVYDVDPETFVVQDLRQVTMTKAAAAVANANQHHHQISPLAPAAYQPIGESFRAAMGLPDLSTKSLYALADGMRHNASTARFDRFWLYVQGGWAEPQHATCDSMCKNTKCCELIAGNVIEAGICVL